MERYVFDVEVFVNMFCVTFLSIDTQKKDTFVIYKTRDDSVLLSEFLNREIFLFGFNNLTYDGVILNSVLQNHNSFNFLRELFELSQTIISDNSFYGRRRQRSDIAYPFHHIDLMKILAADKLGIPLKQLGITLRWFRIQDLPLPYNHEIEPDEISIVLDYNMNDVLITLELYKAMLPLIELREKLGILFGADLSSASDSKIANILLESFYKKNGGDLDTIRSLRTVRTQFLLSECFGKNIEFKTNKLRRVKNEIGNTVVREKNEFKYKKKIEFGGIEYELGIGGLHSVDKEGIFETSDKYIIQELDAASYYPSIMIVNEIVPQHLGKDFTDILKKITSERLSAKKKKDKVKADGLKICINSIFGKLGSNTFWLNDAKCLCSVTVSGQLYLLMLVESLVLSGIQVISANTDGIICRIPKELENKYKEICVWWQEKTGFELESTNYNRYARTDVNNYVVVKSDGETKTKGRYLTDTEENLLERLKKAYKHPIVARTLFQYFVNNKPIEETIYGSKNILDFAVSQKTGSDFVLEYHVNESVTELQKNNRFYISISGGKLIKRHRDKGTTIGLYVDRNAKVLNNYDKTIPFESYDIDYDFYKTEANKYIEPIEASRYIENVFSFEDESPNYIPIQEMSPNEEVIRLKLDGVKNLSGKVITALVKIDDNFKEGNFFDFMVYAEENSLISKKFGDLIKINYFSRFGKNKKLLAFFLEFTTGKNKYKSTLSEKSKTKRLEELHKVWNSIPEESLTVKDQIDAELKVLGRIDSNFKVNARYAYVLGLSTKYSPRLDLYSLGTGGQAQVKIQKKFYDISPIKEGDVIFTRAFEKKPAVKYVDGNFEEDNSKPPVFWLTSYRVVKDYSEMETQ
jgi:hypothetical protein